eukprot:maker-scaffold342_size201858-snap-gene-0.18 protein:Tk00005 transcript:maker-scaffold342_size201858-snap-gene-0.18-mRNA-1 annotation:"hydrogenase expression formation protein"
MSALHLINGNQNLEAIVCLILFSVLGTSSERPFEPATGHQVAFPRKTILKESPIPKIFSKNTASLSVQVYKTLKDAAIFDWYISLNDKDQMRSCDVVYKSNVSNDSILLSPFLPKTRTFFIAELEPESEYEFHMLCEDHNGRDYITKPIFFTTASEDTPSVQDLKGNLTRGHDLSREEVLLPAISSSVVNGRHQGPILSTQRRRWNMKSEKISPHFVLGISCGIVGLVLILVTLALAGNRYVKYRSSPSRLWELQTVRELELSRPPSYIDIPMVIPLASGLPPQSSESFQSLSPTESNGICQNQTCCHNYQLISQGEPNSPMIEDTNANLI